MVSAFRNLPDCGDEAYTGSTTRKCLLSNVGHSDQKSAMEVPPQSDFVDELELLWINKIF